jgi:large subunit ribosomal protein L37Ae
LKGLWGSLVSLSGLGPDDPGSNPGNPIIKKMATKLKKTKSAGRFGPRYGRRIRKKIIKIESQQRIKQKCPFCEKERTKRLAKGIWKCEKCEKKFASNTYYLN